jgi:hypothetical protein
VERNDIHGNSLSKFFAQARVASNLESSVSITRWAYSQTAGANGLVWVEGDLLRHLGSEWVRLLEVA